MMGSEICKLYFTQSYFGQSAQNGEEMFFLDCPD